MIAEHFDRRELVFSLASEAAATILLRLPTVAAENGGTLTPPTLVETLYYDNDVSELYTMGRDGAEEQLQFRVRSYGSAPSLCYLEVKRRSGSTTQKVRTVVNPAALAAAEDFKLFQVGATDQSVFRSALSVLSEKRLSPVLLMRYSRSSIDVSEPDGFRLTMDTSISAEAIPSRLKISLSPAIVEVKSAQVSDRLDKVMSELGLGSPTSFSKFLACRRALDEISAWH